MENIREILTPEQAADYLQINRETVYRYIRSGKLVASPLGTAIGYPGEAWTFCSGQPALSPG